MMLEENLNPDLAFGEDVVQRFIFDPCIGSKHQANEETDGWEEVSW